MISHSGPILRAGSSLKYPKLDRVHRAAFGTSQTAPNKTMPFSVFRTRPPVSAPSAAVQVVVRVRPWSDREKLDNTTPVVSFRELHHSDMEQRHTQATAAAVNSGVKAQFH